MVALGSYPNFYTALFSEGWEDKSVAQYSRFLSDYLLVFYNVDRTYRYILHTVRLPVEQLMALVRNITDRVGIRLEEGQEHGFPKRPETSQWRISPVREPMLETCTQD
jgi:hypothetical protein